MRKQKFLNIIGTVLLIIGAYTGAKAQWNGADIGLMKVGQSFTGSITPPTSGSATYAVASGSLPPGITLNTSTGSISGTPTTAGTYNFTLSVTQSGNTGSRKFIRTVYPDFSADLFVWGSLSSGMLATGEATNVRVTQKTPNRIPSPVQPWAKVAIGRKVGMALTADGKIFVWGNNINGGFGNGSTNIDPSTDTSIRPFCIGSCNNPQPTWVHVGAGAEFGLAISTTGELYIWGTNSSGLGNGATLATTPVSIPAPAGEGWLTAEGGEGHVVALTNTGKVYTWGKNSKGQIGNGNTTDAGSPYLVSALSGKSAASIGIGYDHSIIVTDAGELYAWGNNDSGQLGNNSTTNSSTPLLIGTGWKQASGGYQHSIGLKTNGTLWGWGSNSNYQLADGTTTNSSVPKAITTNLTGVNFAGLWVGHYSDNVMLYTPEGDRWAWGDNYSYMLGDGTNSDVASPLKLDPTIRWYHLTTNSEVSAGIGLSIIFLDKKEFTLAAGGSTETRIATVAPVISNQTVTWTSSNPAVATVDPATGKVTPISAGTAVITASVTDGGKTYSATSTVTVGVPPVWTDQTISGCIQTGVAYSDGVSASSSATVTYSVSAGTLPAGLSLNGSTGALTGTPTATGSVAYDFTIKAANSFGEVTKQFTGKFFRQGVSNMGTMVAGTAFTGNMNTEGTGITFSVTSGALPDGLALDTSTGAITGTPSKPGIFNFVVTATIGSSCSVSLLFNELVAAPPQYGHIFAAGNDYFGRLGNGNTYWDRCLGRITSVNEDWKMVVAGQSHTLGLTADGRIFSWGKNTEGQLGIPSVSINGIQSTPAQVCIGNCSSLQPKWAYIAASRDVSFALTEEGKLYAWGPNIDGLLGTSRPDTDRALEPTEIPVPTGQVWSLISAGREHILAITQSGRMYSWGNNSNHGKLGNGVSLGSATKEFAPVEIGASLGKFWTKISAGYRHSMAIANDGSLYTFGANSAAQLGNGSFGPTISDNKNVPTLVADPPLVFKEILGGRDYSLAITTDGDLYGWGANNNGQLGTGAVTTTYVSKPALINSEKEWRYLSIGNYEVPSSAAITENGDLYTWGGNFAGTLGNCSEVGALNTTRVTTPARVGASTRWYQVSGNLEILVGAGTEIITLNKAAAHLIEGGATEKLNETISPLLGSTGVTWTSLDAAKATVAADGSITPVVSGSSMIRATTSDGLYYSQVPAYINSKPAISLSAEKCGPVNLTLTGGHLIFDGTNDQLTFVNKLKDLPTGDSRFFTLEFLVNIDAHITGQRIIDIKQGTGLVSTHGAFYLTPSGGSNGKKLELVMKLPFGGIIKGETLSDFPVGKWTHVALVFTQSTDYNKSEMLIYVDGKLDLSTQNLFTFRPPELFIYNSDQTSNYFGASNDYAGITNAATGTFLKGRLDEFRMWKIALSARQVQDAIGQRFPSDYPGLISLIRFDEMTGIDAASNSAYITTVKLVNGPVWSQDARSPADMKDVIWSSGTPSASEYSAEISESGDYDIQVTDFYNKSASITSSVLLNTCPIATDDELQGFKNVPITGNLTTNDVDPEGGLNIKKINFSNVDFLPVNGEITITVSNKGALVVNTDGSYTFTPDTGFIGTISGFTAFIEDGSGAATISAITIDVVDPIILDKETFNLPAGGASETRVATVVTGISNQTVTWTSSDPAVATVDPATGEVTPISAGTAVITASVTDGGKTYSATSTVTVGVPPVWTDEAISCFQTGVAYSDGVSASSTTIVTYSVGSGLPAGLTLNTSTGAIDGTPTATGSVAYDFTIKAANSFGEVTKQFTGQFFRVATHNIGVMKSGVQFSGTVNVEGAVNYSVTNGSLPTGLTLHTSTGAITGTPTKPGFFTFLITATSGTCKADLLFTEFVAAEGPVQLFSMGRSYQLGTGSQIDQACPQLITEPSNQEWTMIVSGDGHSMALTYNGELWVWGNNPNGELGLADVTKSSSSYVFTPRRLCLNGDCNTTQPVWKYIAAGAYTSYAITRDGAMYAWGENRNGECGTGVSTGNNGSDNTVPVLVSTPAGERWAVVNPGYSHAMAITESGKLYSWGFNWSYGVLGNSTNTKELTPLQVAPLDKIWIRAMGGYNNSAAITKDGELYMWGRNHYGQLGDGTTTNNSTPSLIASDKVWIEVSPREYHTLAIDNQGDLYSWGYNDNGQLGLGNTTNYSTPQLVDNTSNWVALPTGSSYTSASAAITDEGFLYTWGDNQNGQLGNCSFTEKPDRPKRIGESIQWFTFSQSYSSSLGTALPLISLDKAAVHLIETGTGDSFVATVPSFVADPTVTWSLTDAAVATIDQSGNVTPKANGITTVKASISQGKFFTNSTVYVNRVPQVIQADPAEKCGSKILSVEGSSIGFDGTDDHLSFNSDLYNLASKSEFTFEAWVYIDAHVTGQRIVDMKGNGSILFYLTPSGGSNNQKLTCTVNAGFFGVRSFSSANDFPTGKWTHVAVVFNSSTSSATFYVDGKFDTIGTAFYINTPLSMGATTSNYIARSNDYTGVTGATTGTYLKGRVDEIRMWNTARTEAQILNTMGMQLPATYPGLVSMLRLDEVEGTTASDTRSGSLISNITLQNGAYWDVPSGAGIAMQSFLWNNGTTTNKNVVTAIGDYQVQVIDYYGASATATSNLAAINACPIATDDGLQGFKNVPITGNLTTNDVDPEGGLNIKKINFSNVDFLPVNGKITITISNKGVLVVNTDGSYTFTPDTGFIGTISGFTASIEDGSGAATTSAITIDVVDPIVLDKNLVILFEGSNGTDINETVTDKLSNKAVTWSVSDPAIATVDANGILTPLSKGNITVTATTVEGGYKATATVFVRAKPVIGVKPSETKCGYADLGASGSVLVFSGEGPAKWSNPYAVPTTWGTYVTMPNNLQSTPNFTFEAWIYIDAHRDWQRVIDFGKNSSVYFFLTTSPMSKRPRFGISVSGAGAPEQKLDSNTDFPVQQWTHMAIVVDGTSNTGYMYMNGVEVARNTSMTLNPTKLGGTTNNYLGKSQFNDNWFFKGKMDEIRLWNVARSSQQILDGMNLRYPAKYPGLINYYQLDEGTGTTIKDDSPAGNIGTIIPSNYVDPGTTPQSTWNSCCGGIPWTSKIWENPGSSPSETFQSYLWSTGATTREARVTQSGTYSVTLTDVFGNVVTTSTTVTINTCPSAVNDILTAQKDQPLTGNVITNDSDAEGGVSVKKLTYNNSDILPVNGVMNLTIPNKGTVVMNTDGSFTFTPASGYFGPVPDISVTIQDAEGGTATAPLSLVVNAPPSVTDKTLDAAQDSPATGDLTGANDTDAENQSLTITKLDIGGTSYTPAADGSITAAIAGKGTIVVQPDGAYVFTPEPGYFGSVPVITYTASDGAGGTDTGSLTIAINGKPVLAGDNLTGIKDQAISGGVLSNDTDPENGTLKVEQIVVDGVTATPDANGDMTAVVPGKGTVVFKSDGTYTFTPETGFYGPLKVDYTACDDGAAKACSTASLNLTIDPFTPRPDAAAGFINLPVKGSVAGNDLVPADKTYSLDGADANNPSGASFTLNADGTYDFQATTPGTYVYNTKVCSTDGASTQVCSVQALTIVVADQDIKTNPPFVNGDVASVAQDGSVSINVLGNDLSGNTNNVLVPSSLKIKTQPANGTVTIDANGKVLYTPNAGYVGTDTFTYEVCDNQSTPVCSTATVSVDVQKSGTPNTTTAADDFAITIGPIPVSGNLLANDTDPSGNSRTVTPQSLTLTEGTIAINADGSYTFTGNPTFSGTVSVPYTVCDNGTPQACTFATLFVVVREATIDAVDDDFSANKVNGFTGGTAGTVLTNDLVNNDPLVSSQVILTLLSSGGITGAAINSTSGNLTVPAATKAGTYSVRYKVCIGAVPVVCDEATATVVVIPPVLDAVDDDYSDEIISNELGGSRGSIFENDQISGQTISGNLLTPTITNNGGLEGVSISKDGVITIPPGFEPGDYTLTIQICEDLNPTNCTESTVTIKIEYTELVPAGAVTPNGDGKNDFFHIRGLSAFPDHSLTIVNRWGNVVFKAAPYRNDWDGRSQNGLTFSGSDKVPAGTYFFVLDKGDGKKVTGSFYLAY